MSQSLRNYWNWFQVSFRDFQTNLVNFVKLIYSSFQALLCPTLQGCCVNSKGNLAEYDMNYLNKWEARCMGLWPLLEGK